MLASFILGQVPNSKAKEARPVVPGAPDQSLEARVKKVTMHEAYLAYECASSTLADNVCCVTAVKTSVMSTSPPTQLLCSLITL